MYPAFRMPCIRAVSIAASACIRGSLWTVCLQCLRISPGCLKKALTAERMCRGGHSDDVIDAAWAPDVTALLTGSTENVCVVWDVEKGEAQGRLTEHGHHVQGVAWDPSRQYIISQSADRTCRSATHPLHSPQSWYVQCLHWDPMQDCVASRSAECNCNCNCGYVSTVKQSGGLHAKDLSAKTSCRVYGPKVAAPGIRGKAQARTAVAMSKDLICQGTMRKYQLPPGVLLGPLCLHLETTHL